MSAFQARPIPLKTQFFASLVYLEMNERGSSTANPIENIVLDNCEHISKINERSSSEASPIEKTVLGNC